jgi:aspartyl-tRNA(Asn)/glutamyl-tRNA(Gln) amidotransferase subunit C
MPLTRAEVQEIAALARIRLADHEAERLVGDLGAILGYVEELQAIDTTGVEPMTHAVPMDLYLRADVAGPSLDVADALAAAPAREEDFFAVPKVIEGGKS